MENDFLSIISDYLTKLYKFFYLKDAGMVMNLMNLYLSTNISHNKALEYIENKENLKNFKEFLIMDYISYKVFEIIPTLIKKNKDDYLVDELEDFKDIKINENTNDNQNNEGKVFTRKDFEDSDQEYSEEDEDNKMKKIIKPINSEKKISNKKTDEDKIKQWEFPTRLGSFQNFSNVALEYIKFLTEVLSIDSDISDLAYKVKKNSLKLINVEEFSKETIFLDPCRTFILHDVVCEFCSNNKDFDFCRDTSILDNEWKCELCNTTFDRNYIEFLIIQKVKSFVDYYFNQDLKCKKCMMQKNEMIFIRCECAGDFVKTYEDNILKKTGNINNMDEFLNIILNIANYYRFDNLKAMLEQVIFIH